MLLFPFGAMNGWVGGSGAETGCTPAGLPMKVGRLEAPGPSGMGTGSTADAASGAAASAIVTPHPLRARHA
jgi:hypothetical protein